MAFPMQDQQQSHWCWAAVTASVDSFYSGAAARTQCLVAGAVLGAGCCGANGPLCNQAANLGNALSVIGRFRQRIVGRLSFDQLKAQIDGQRPVGIRIQWRGAGGHYLLVTGYEAASSAQLVEVSDPALPDGLIPYDTLCETYQNSERPGRSSGFWSHTYLLV